MGTKYDLKYSYEAETTYVLGEFYWQVSAGRKPATATSPAQGPAVDGAEPNEVTWSAATSSADTVAKAFKLDDKKDLLQRDDPAPSWRPRARAAAR
jgi:hypothetical protein